MGVESTCDDSTMEYNVFCRHYLRTFYDCTVTMAKGIGNGFPLAAVATTEGERLRVGQVVQVSCMFSGTSLIRTSL